jgi:hypothetical protein
MTLLSLNYNTQMVVIEGNYGHYGIDFLYGAFI